MNFEDRRKLSNIGNAIVRLLVKFMTWKEKIGHSVTSGVHKIETSQTVFGEEVRRKLVFKSHTFHQATQHKQHTKIWPQHKDYTWTDNFFIITKYLWWDYLLKKNKILDWFFFLPSFLPPFFKSFVPVYSEALLRSQQYFQMGDLQAYL